MGKRKSCTEKRHKRLAIVALHAADKKSIEAAVYAS